MAKSNLASAMRRVAKPASAVKPDESTIARPGRDGKSPVTGFFGLDVKKQLRILTAEQSTTIQKLLAEALNDIFVKYGKPAIVPLDE